MLFLRRLWFELAYFRRPRWDTGVSPPELLEFIQSHPSGRALDMGCGTGTNVITLARHGWQASGVDFSAKAVRAARRKAQQANIEADFWVDDVTRLRGLSGPYDLIVDIGCFHGLSQAGREAYVRNVHRLLARGGFYLLYAFLRPEEGGGEVGLGEADLEMLSARLKLVRRLDCRERGVRPAVWLTYTKSAL